MIIEAYCFECGQYRKCKKDHQGCFICESCKLVVATQISDN